MAFRVDASPLSGTGHLMRCLTLANALRKVGAQSRFFCRELPLHLEKVVRDSGHGVVRLADDARRRDAGAGEYADWLGTTLDADADEVVAALAGQPQDWLVVDHYALDARWESRVRAAARRILAIDDLANRQHNCDVLLDQNFYSDLASRYDGLVSRHCRLLLGPRYALLRDGFRQAREHVAPRVGAVRRLFVFLSGVDGSNYTALVIDAVARLGDKRLAVDVVIGTQHPARAEVEQLCVRHGYACHVQTDRMAQLMAAADLAIGAGGAASWERCCLGLPTLVLQLAENQKRLIADAVSAGLLCTMDLRGDITSAMERRLRELIQDQSLRERMSRRGLETVDGHGASRVVRAMTVTVREATVADSGDLYTWRNHEVVRRMSRNQTPISRADHEAWFAAVLRDPNRLPLVGELLGAPIGVVRFDIAQTIAEISIYLDPDQLGSGLGPELLSQAELWLTARRPDVRAFKAEVLLDNERSHRLFRNGGYVQNSGAYMKSVRP